MKIVGIALFWIGIVMLLKNIGFIQVVDSTLGWAIVFIVLGSALKHGCRHWRMGGMMGKWGGKEGMGPMGEGHKCMGCGCDCAACGK